MVKQLTWLAAFAAAGCQLPLTQTCLPDGGANQCPAGTYCDTADFFCHSTTGVAGSNGATGATATSSGAATNGTASGTAASGTSSGAASGNGASTTSGGPSCTVSTLDGGAEQVIQGTVILPGDSYGQLYVQLVDVSQANNGFFTPLLQTSLYVDGGNTAAFTLHGAQYLQNPSDAMAVGAWIDTLQTGVPNAGVDQIGASAPLSLAALIDGGVQVELGYQALAPDGGGPSFQGAVRGTDGNVLVLWGRLVADAGLPAEAVASYRVCLSDGGSGEICDTFPAGAGNTGVGLLPAPVGFDLVTVQGLFNGVGGGLTNGTLSTAQGAQRISGTVQGIAGIDAPIHVIAVGPSVAVTGISDAGAFSFDDLPGGAYAMFVFADLGGTGSLVPGDPTDLVAGGNIYACVAGQTSCNPTLGSGAAIPTLSVKTTVGPDGGLLYALVPDVAANEGLPLSATVQLDATQSVDLPLENQGPPVVSLGTTLAGSATPPPSCVSYAVTFADGGQRTYVLPVTYIPAVPTVTAVAGTLVVFSPLASDAGSFTYTCQICGQGGNSASSPVESSPCYLPSLGAGQAVTVIATDSAGNVAQSACFGSNGSGGGNGSGSSSGGGSGSGSGGSSGSSGPLTVTGTVTVDAGSTSPVIFVQLFNDNGVVAGTAILPDAGGTFTVQSLSGGQALTAWADVAGTGHYIPALDPSGAAAVTSSGNVGQLALTLPTLNSPQSPSIDELYAGDTGFVVLAAPSLSGSTELASSYEVDMWSANPPSGSLLASRTFPAGGSLAAIFTTEDLPGLDAGTYYFTVTALSPGAAGVQSSAQSISFPLPIADTFSGALSTPFSSGSFYIGDPSGFGTNALSGTSYQASLTPQAEGLWYLADVNGDGIIETTEPSVGPSNNLLGTEWSWDGGPVGPTITIAPDAVLCSINQSSQQQGTSGTPTYTLTYTLTFNVQSNLQIPLTAFLDGGPNLSGPLSLGAGSSPAYQPQATQLTGVAPGLSSVQGGDAYTLNVVTPDAGMTCTASVPAVMTPPEMLEIDVSHARVSWFWQAPSGNGSYQATASAQLASDGTPVWFVPNIVIAPDDGPAIFVPIADDTRPGDDGFQKGLMYQLTVQITDGFGDSATTTTNLEAQ